MIYVRALVALENARAVTPLLALPTAGAGVADRVRRILGIRGGTRDWQSAVAALVFAAILVGAGMWQPTLAGPVSPPQIQQPPVQQPQAQAPPPAAPLNALIAIATAEGVRESQRGGAAALAPAQKVTQPTIAASREAARDRLGLMQVEYSAESFVKQAAEGDTIAVKTFLAAGMNINVRSEGYTALMKAADAGQTETVQALLAAGADPDLTSVQGSSPLVLAASRGDLSTMKVLIAGGAQVDLKAPYNQGSALVHAAFSGRRDAVILLLDNKASIEARSEYWGTALLAAACQGHFDTARALVDRGANVKALSRLDWPSNTPLHCAAIYGNAEFTQLLLDKGADINAKADKAYTPLMTALTSGRLERNPSVSLLIDRGADLNAITDDGYTALSFAVARRQIDLVRALLTKGADPNKKGKNRDGVLLDHLGLGGGIVREGGVEIALLLINGGADVNAVLFNGTSALFLAVQAKQIDVVRALLAKGADPNKAPNNIRITPLQAAVEAPEIRQLLIDAGAKQ